MAEKVKEKDKKDKEKIKGPAIAAHGASRLPSVDVDSYNIELRDDEGFVGYRANKGAFRDILDVLRKNLRKNGEDPLGDDDTHELTKDRIDTLLAKGDPEAAGVVHAAIEEFSQELASVIRRYLKTKAWRDTERIVVGGGLRDSRVGELVIGRAAVLLKTAKIEIELVPIRHHPDEAGLLGAAHLAPAWLFKGHDAIVAVDIGGTNIRAGVVQLNLKKSRELEKAKVWKSSLWRHADEKLKREQAVNELIGMIEKLIRAANKEDIGLAPFIGIGCPGLIEEDGSIDRGAQNLPGNWSGKDFNLPHAIYEAIPRIGDDETAILIHNDAVIQGLSEVPFMTDVQHWGVLTIGTGLGNARFTNRQLEN
jgi:predicted NBD/HSP70 family sugar kinase